MILKPITGPEVRSAPIEIVTNSEFALRVGAEVGLYDTLRSFAFGEPSEIDSSQPTSEVDLKIVLDDYARKMTTAAVSENHIDIDLLQVGYDQMVHDMNLIANQKLGYAPPRGLVDALFQRLGLALPNLYPSFVTHTQSFWNGTFLADFKAGEIPSGLQSVKRETGESNRSFMQRYYAQVLTGNTYNNFTFVQQAKHRA